MTISFEEALCTLLVKHKVLSAQEAYQLQHDFKGRSKERFDDFLLSEGIVTKEQLLQVLAEYFDVPAFNVVGHFFSRDLLHRFPYDVLVRHEVIPLERDGNMIALVASNPHKAEDVQELTQCLSEDFHFMVGIGPDIVDAINEYYEQSPFTSDDEIDQTEMDQDEVEAFEDVLDHSK